MAMLPCEDNRSARTTNRVGAKAVFEKHALRGKLIDIRGWVHLLEPTVISTDGVRGVIV